MGIVVERWAPSHGYVKFETAPAEATPIIDTALVLVPVKNKYPSWAAIPEKALFVHSVPIVPLSTNRVYR